mmetsp:Transcript_48600/g.135814  ORF Transcript_48600/g.135814 Transcript_48600/m.135814 type:complete len:418 (+) Transcript_48600:86-1339(+)
MGAEKETVEAETVPVQADAESKEQEETGETKEARPKQALAPTALLVKVPENVKPGEAVSFPGPDGSQMQAVVPEGKAPGDKFEVRLPVATLTVPEGSKAGDLIYFDGPGNVKMQAFVPEGLEPGDQFQAPIVIPPTFVTLAVPEGVEPGHMVYFPGPGGVQMKTQVPEGKKPGDQFQVPLAPPQTQQTFQVQLKVPEGLKAGDAISFPGPNGAPMQAVIPEGKEPGDEFSVLVQPPPAPLTVTVPEGAKAGQVIKFQAPDGSFLTTAVPEGLKEGDTFPVSLASKEHYNLGQLCTAASGEDLEAVKKWVEEGIPVDGVYDLGFTPLIYAAMHGRKHIVEWLLDQKADVTAKTNDSRTPLHFACRNGHTEVALLLLEAEGGKEMATVKDILKRTPLATAKEKNQMDTAKALEEAGVTE